MAARLVFLFLLTASLLYFLRVLWRRLEPMRNARPALPTPPAGKIGQRVWRTFSEVMLQTRVIRERPVAGVLHALVMWGFFVFAWVSLEHLWLGVSGLDPAHADRSWYGGFAAVWAAVAIDLGLTEPEYEAFMLLVFVPGYMAVYAEQRSGEAFAFLRGWHSQLPR